MRTVTVGILAPSPESGGILRAQVRTTGLGTVAVEVTEYVRSRSDNGTRRLVDGRPEVVLIDADDVPAALESVRILRTAVPAAWIVVCTASSNAQTILEFVRAGAREILPSPISQDSLSQALRRHIEESDRERKSDSNAHGKVFSVCAAKRGSGATTVAINLAASLAELPNARVALIDLDWPLGDAAAYLNISPRYTVSNALSEAARLDSILLESYMHKHDKIQVLAGLEDFEAGDELKPDSLGQLLEVAMQTYTHAVVDLPLSLTHELLQTVTRVSNTILAVMTPDLPSLRRSERLLRFLSRFEATDQIRLILNRTKKSDEITEGDVEKALKHPVSWKISNDYYACMEAINSGKPLLSNKALAREFRDKARQLAGFEPEGKRRGLLNLLPKTSSPF